MKIKKSQYAVSDVVGTMLLLGMAVALFTIVYISVLSVPSSPPIPSLNIVGKIVDEDIIIDHMGGKPLDMDTTLLVTIAGDRTKVTIGEWLDNESKENNVWNSGERLVYPVGNVTGLQVELAVADKGSNSLVLLGPLKEGYVKPPHGRGGIWHFNEGSGSIANDSSGNRNHGTIYDAAWTTGVNSTALYYDGLDDYVFVPDSYSLDISKNITIEAWLKPEELDDYINKSYFDSAFGYYPNITHVSGNIYAIVYRQGPNTNKDGILKTLDVRSNGWIANVSLDELTFSSGCNEPKILYISDSIVSIAYRDNSNDGHIKSYSISSSGGITYTGNSLSIGSNYDELSFIHLYDDKYAVVYGGSSGGIIKTFNISSYGVISYTGKSYTFDTQCEDPDITWINDDLYAIAYIGSGGDKIRTFFINGSGNIMYSGNYYVFFNGCDDPDIFKVSNSTIAVTFENNIKGGIVRTYNIDGLGSISYTGNSLQFEDDDCHDPDMIDIYSDVYAITYEGPNGHIGRIAKVEITSTGQIIQLISVRDYDKDRGCESNIIHISDHILMVTYRKKTPHPGGIMTLTYASDLIDPAYHAGIYKDSSYGIFANTTMAYGYINNQTISGSISNGWNHIVLIYDQSTMALYANGTLITSQSYSQTINVNNNEVLFGNFFHGMIDEIAIYDRALSEEEIIEHFENPGSFS